MSIASTIPSGFTKREPPLSPIIKSRIEFQGLEPLSTIPPDPTGRLADLGA